MQVSETQEAVVQKIGNFTGQESPFGLEQSKLRVNGDHVNTSTIIELIEQGVVERVDEITTSGPVEQEYRLTNKGWEMYHES